MTFQIVGLNRAQFAPLFGLSDLDLAARNVVRQLAEKSATNRFPCRVSLKDADAGESVLLMNFEHLPVASPYRSRYAIYVRENAVDVQLAVDEIPEVMQQRPLSVRAFDSAGTLLDADLAQGENLVPTLERLLGPARTEYLHVHNAKHGCFVARVNRL
jgi:Protein of unknown function (DUF1203)